MKIRYFQDTDTLYIEFRQSPVAETRDLDENTQVDFDERGGICAMTLEHASERADLPALDYQQVAAWTKGPARDQSIRAMQKIRLSAISRG